MSGAEEQKAGQRERQNFNDESSTSTADEATKDAADGTEEIEKAPWRSLFFFTTRSNIPLLVLGITASILSGASGPAQNLIVGQLYEGFTSYSSGTIAKDEFLRQMSKYVLYQVAVAGGSWVLHSIEFMTWLAFGELQAKSARDRLFHGLLEKEIEWYDRRKNGIGALLPRLQAQIRELQLATAQPMGELLSFAATAILSLIQAFVRSWDLTLVTLSTVPVIMLIIGACGRPMQRNLHKQQDKLTEAQKHSTSALSSIDTVKCFNGQEIEEEKYMDCIDEAADWYGWVANANALQMGFLALLTLSLFVQGFYYGGTLVAKGKLNSGDVVTCFFSAVGAFQAIASILPQMIVFEKGRVAGSTLRTIMAQIEGGSKVEKTEGLLAPTTCRGDIDVEGLSFAYPSRPDHFAIRNVTLCLQGGDMTFLIGKSGSGKSTIGQLLMRFYTAEEGVIKIDGVPLASLDTNWLRSNITLVEQTSLLFNDTIFNNIAFGSHDHDKVTKEEVAKAVEFALLQLTITDLPDGLDTAVGAKGGSLSGGQRQRMALARARLRDTPVLILDESTSALDHISRTLMMEAIRRWRQGKTTIIITHDISQILPNDYIYLLENGQLVQEGHRKHLEHMKGSPFQAFLSEEQQAMASYDESLYSEAESPSTPGSSMTSFAQITRTSNFDLESDPLERQLTASDKMKKTKNRTSFLPGVITQGSPLVGLRPHGTSGWMKVAYSPPIDLPSLNTKVTSPNAATTPSPVGDDTPASAKRWSLVFRDLVDQTGKMAAEARKRTALTPARRRQQRDSMAIPLTDRRASQTTLERNQSSEQPVELNSLKYIFSTLWPNLDKGGRICLILGFYAASVHAVVTPAFGYILSKLLATYAIPGGDKKQSLTYSMVILGLAVTDAIHTWMYRFFHEYSSQLWVDRIRAQAYTRILDQSRDFFEKEEYGVSRLTENLDRNAEEMRNLLGRFASLAYVAALMIIVSIIWALVSQWKMTLIALAVGPYVFGVTKMFASISEKWEGRSNDASEAASAIFTETFTNIKTVRALTMETYFVNKYIAATNLTLRVGFRRSFYAGFFFGLADSAGNFSIGLIFYIATKLIIGGAKVTNIVSVLTMLIFLIGAVSNILGYIPQIGSSKDTAGRLLHLATLPKDSHEHLGDTRITSIGDVIFDKLRFAYPSRPEQTVLKDICLHLQPGAATAIVGGSGSGKSTIANLLLDLYSTTTMPDGGKIGDLTFGGRDIRHIHTPSLRALVVSVSQTPTLFAATIAGNIAYGLPGTPQEAIETAAQQAGIHDFVASLPLGYSTPVGEGGMGISGGQAQRLAIARALVRKPSVLILDEATSALDVESANLVRETLHNLIYNKSRAMTVIVITHHRDMMEICERIVVLEQGSIVEEGSFGELMGKGGALANLLGGGEWNAEREEARKKKKRKDRKSGVPILKDVDWSKTRKGRKGRKRAVDAPPAVAEE